VFWDGLRVGSGPDLIWAGYGSNVNEFSRIYFARIKDGKIGQGRLMRAVSRVAWGLPKSVIQRILDSRRDIPADAFRSLERIERHSLRIPDSSALRTN
jgi:hypothetical protein